MDVIHVEEEIYVTVEQDNGRRKEGFPFKSLEIAEEVADQAKLQREVQILSEIGTSGLVKWALEKIRSNDFLLCQAIEIKHNLQDAWSHDKDYTPPKGIPAETIAALLLTWDGDEPIPVDHNANKIRTSKMKRQPHFSSTWDLVEVLQSPVK